MEIVGFYGVMKMLLGESIWQPVPIVPLCDLTSRNNEEADGDTALFVCFSVCVCSRISLCGCGRGEKKGRAPM